MRNCKMSLALLAIGAGLLASTGCQRYSKSETYYLISNNLKLNYWKTANDGFVKAAADIGVTARLDGPDTFDPQAEEAAFEKAVAAKPSGILISVADATLMTAEINTAIAAGIPVITMDSDAPGSNRLMFVGTNNLEAGRLGGARLVFKLNGKGNVAFFSMPGQPNLDERLKGYKDVLSSHPDIKVVEVFNVKGDAGSAFDEAQRLVAKTGADKIDAFVSLESTSGKGIADVLRRVSATDRTLIAMDVDADTLKLVNLGEIDSTISQRPYTMGYVGLKQLAEIHHALPQHFGTDYGSDPHSPYPVFIDTGTALVDQTNVDRFMKSGSE
ncbi:substrate-binding domain-containing protein [Granulicella arctica]|uniref:Ribose transport system substrate-binding protein n=1 Tax=Granulicella arctica TaxID=940613 RepID=A0A7Y9TUJ3_9BACT|nr:substrate-binding domain-containing protein [Granulicella arctica]NYF80923.1 ribose transport system substrate-binding protein [Granulicella arctica]